MRNLAFRIPKKEASYVPHRLKKVMNAFECLNLASQDHFSIIYIASPGNPPFFFFTLLFRIQHTKNFDMDQIDLNTWLNGDDDIMDTLVGLASIPDEPASSHQSSQNSGADILEYLLQTGNIHSNGNPAFQPLIAQPHPPTAPAPPSTSTPQQTSQVMEQQPCAPAPIVISDAVFRDAVSVVQEKDNFVTFLPHSTPATKKKQSGPKKAKFKEPIFVTESPQSYKKKKKAASSTAAPSNQSSADENSDDDMLLEDDMHHSNSSMKQMTSKERRQLRNKISARNFRVRRKGKLPIRHCKHIASSHSWNCIEYITQL